MYSPFSQSKHCLKASIDNLHQIPSHGTPTPYLFSCYAYSLLDTLPPQYYHRLWSLFFVNIFHHYLLLSTVIQSARIIDVILNTVTAAV